MIEYDKFQLKNGVKGILVPLPGLHSVTVEVFVKIGSKYESSKVYGISHFLEHMAFKGTKRRPGASAIHMELDSRGASHNAGTGHELTSYYIKTIKENVGWALDVLSDILLNATYPEAEFEKEKGVIVEEMRMYEDNPAMGLTSDFMEMMYQDTGIGCWNIAGTVKSVTEIGRKDLIEFKEKYLNPNNMVVVVTGDVGDAANREMIKNDIFNEFGNVSDNCIDLPQVEMKLKDSKYLSKSKQIEQAHFCLGVPSISWKDKRKHISRLADVILCGNASSRIYEKIREEHGWAYYIYGISDMLAEGGFNGVQEGVAMDKLEMAIELTKKEYLDFGGSVTETELERAKDYLMGKAKLNMDRTDFWSDFVGQRMLLENKIESIEDEIEKYKRVTLKEVKQYAEDFFAEEAFRLMVVKR